jgi:hypothetical protein
MDHDRTPTAIDGLVTLAQLAERLKCSPSSLRSALSRNVTWLPPADGRIGRTLVWRAATVAQVKRPKIGRPKGSKDRKVDGAALAPQEAVPPADAPTT